MLKSSEISTIQKKLHFVWQCSVKYLIFVFVVSGCTGQFNNAKFQTNLEFVPTFVPIPESITAHSNQDLAAAADSATNIQASMSVYIERNNTFENIQLSSVTLFRKNRVGYVLGKYSQANQIYVVVSFPSNFQISKYYITQALNTAPDYSSADGSLPAAVLRNLPQNLSPFGEPETDGESCNQSVSGQLTITDGKPLQGNFQFRCQFQDGRWASVAATFSQ